MPNILMAAFHVTLDARQSRRGTNLPTCQHTLSDPQHFLHGHFAKGSQDNSVALVFHVIVSAVSRPMPCSKSRALLHEPLCVCLRASQERGPHPLQPALPARLARAPVCQPRRLQVTRHNTQRRNWSLTEGRCCSSARAPQRVGSTPTHTSPPGSQRGT